MSPFKAPTWNEAVKQRLKEKKDEEELAAKMKEHDYSECYCHALKKPPWGGYSIEEQILYEIKQRRRRGGQGKRQATGTSSYKYLKKDQAAILEEAAGKGTLQTTKSVQMFLLPNSGLISRSSEQELFSELIAAQLGHVSISKVDKAHTPSVVAITHHSVLTSSRSTRLEDLPNEVLCKIISNLDPPELGTLSEASRCLTIVIGPVPCGDAFVWARHRCLIHGHTRHASLCGDCIAALIARNKYDVPMILCKIKGLLPVVAAFASRVMRLGSVLGTLRREMGQRLLRFDQGNTRQVRVTVDVRARYGEVVVPY
ncbi:hypothetical protein HO133_001819 [Letharia lupina]|uniref:F-box domain-containing protein n=1 Tax=Letharia lupina TaxID=560253 RepID=A0A8H6CEM5_9LECA|nr:uncharacterized protein HO133_001819 [Letharia lupina]KAF6221851.1 hypothetical protein HO133_001819 [Letharia lupina]